MSNSVPSVVPALAVVAILTASMVVGVYLAAGTSSHRPGASARPRRLRGNQAQVPNKRRISPVSAFERRVAGQSDNRRSTLEHATQAGPPSVDAPVVQPALGHDLLRQSESAGAATGTTAVGRAPIDQRPVGTPLQRPGTSPYPGRDR
jgi:hypothetical protein